MNPVFCIRNYPFDTLGLTAAALANMHAEAITVDAFQAGLRWPALEEIGGLIVFGGEMNVDEVEDHPFLLTERRLMRRAVDAGLPVLGICLGAQMLARALGASVHRAPVRELGFVLVRLTDAGIRDPLLSAFQGVERVFQWHEDTFELPAGAQLLAVGDAVTNQAFRWGTNAWGIQFHFEIDRENVQRWLELAGPTLERDWKRSADDIRHELGVYLTVQEEAATRVFAAFAQRVVEAAAAMP